MRSGAGRIELPPEQYKVTLLDVLREKLIHLRVNWTPCILDCTLHYPKEGDRVSGVYWLTEGEKGVGCNCNLSWRRHDARNEITHPPSTLTGCGPCDT